MHYSRILFLLGLLCAGFSMPLVAQTVPCGPEPVVDTSGFSGTAFFNYGSKARLSSQRNKMSLAVGQTFIGYLDGLESNSTLGFYSRFLLAPFAVALKATQGELLDRIQLTWEIDALGPSPNDGFNIYRDGVFLASVGGNIRNYNDFNVIAGIAYNYEVRGINVYGEGVGGKAIGFQVPNGTVTGWAQTTNGRPVPDVLVTLTPLQGFSANFGPTEGAYALEDSTTAAFLPPLGQEWTLAFWMKTAYATANAGVASLSPFPLFFRAMTSTGGHEGIEVALTYNTPAFIAGQFPDSTKNDWHHIAFSVDTEGLGRLYIDGILIGIADIPLIPSADEIRLGAKTESSGWTGCLDELRMYHRRLDELDLGEVMMGTGSTLTPNLTHYWKFDEERGVKSFDIINRHNLYLCGATFKLDRPNVRTMGKTNQDGYYRIESASYGTGTTFLAEPMKDFYMYRALKFVRDSQDYAILPDFSVTPKATLELWINSAGADGEQCLISKIWGSNTFRIMLIPNGNNNDIVFHLNSTPYNFGQLGTGYQHLAFTLERIGNTLTVVAYKEGVLLGMNTFPSIAGDWSDPNEPWILGARSTGSGYTDHYGGLIDEVAIYDTTLSVSTILNHFHHARNVQEFGLRVYFNLDEGNGNRLNNSGSLLLPFGTNSGAEWSPFAAHQKTSPHVFSPVTRQVTLNPSVTSVDQVDFMDRSTVPISGYVRYKNTDCFAKNVEIYVNGAPYSPRILTDSTGRFVIDLDPGTTAELTPVFEDHVFVPAFWQVTNVNSPIAGILFNDITTRKIKGLVVGGSKPECKKSIIKAPAGDAQNQGTVCVVEARSVTGCLVRQIIIDNQEGEYEFDELPPLERMTVAVIEHSNETIKSAFQVTGGSVVDISKNDTMIDFIYVAPPDVEIVSGLDPVAGCSPEVIVLDKGENVTLNIKLKEIYVSTPSDDGICYLDTATFSIINGFADMTLDTVMSGGSLMYKFQVGAPNPSPPYLKTIQFLGTSIAGQTGSLVKQAVVTGVKEKLPTFTSKLPERPFLVLHDPPGDGSSAYLEKDSSVCYTTGITRALDLSAGGGTEFNLIPKWVISTGFLIAKETEIRPILGGSIKFKTTTTRSTDSTFQTCLKSTQRISTDDGELIVGGERGGDVFMGAAQNIIFGNVDIVSFDTCTVTVTQTVEITPGDFATTFIYSEFNIQNYVIPNLERLLNSPQTTPADSIAQSIQRWNKILSDNNARKANANAIRNISFDAIASYEYSETVETTHSSNVTRDTIFMDEVTVRGGIFLDDLGGTVGVEFSNSAAFSGSVGNEYQSGNTIGYTLKDNEPGDFFSIDICIDSAYNTPIFKLRAGQSSCPWEPGTANREAPNLQLGVGSQFKAVNVPANEPAVFKMVLGNESASNEDWTYGFTAVAATNPDGAIIKLNGQPLNNNTIQYIVPYGTSIPITLTVERGPIEYEYDSIVVALVSECELQRNLALSIPLDADPKFFSAIPISVDFIRPCSEVNITVPEQNWVVINNDPFQPGTKRRVTVSGYDLSSSDFQLIRIQYRPTDGNGAWINIVDTFEHYNPNWSGFSVLPGPDTPLLGASFTQFIWETAGLADGLYEIHAWAVCTGDASDKPGFSQIIKGRIDREPPSIVGVPQPSDGVYHVGDEISFTFNQHVNCDKLNPVDDVLLFDTETNEQIDVHFTCFENKIILNPLFNNNEFENKIIRAELRAVEDLVGNVFVGTTMNRGIWEFFVDRNELGWLTDSMGMTKYEDENKTAYANIHNRGGYPVPFKILNVPDWVHVVPTQGTLAPNEIRPISFSVDSTLAFGNWEDSIVLHTETGLNPFFMGGDEPLPVGVRVVCRPPYGPINVGHFENTMSMVLRVNIEGVFSTDPEDIVAVFIDDQLRGKANVQFVPQLNTYLAYLTVFGNPDDLLEPIRIEVWDASTCQRYGSVAESFTFQPDNVIGVPNSPQVIHTEGLLLREIPFNFGWNWLSFNLAFPDNNLNAALSTLHHPENDLIRNQTSFATHAGSWFGTLTTLNNTTMYIYRTDQADTLRMTGTPVNPATTHIPLNIGWNWVSYVPNYSLPIDYALGSVEAQPGDIIKSQTAFAQYSQFIEPPDTIYQWIGNLKFMSPPNGYQIKMSNAGTLTYPPAPANLDGHEQARPIAIPADFWMADPSRFEYSSTLIGMLRVEGANATNAQMELGAFAGAEVRGAAKSIYIEPLDAYLFFLTFYANAPDDILRFKLFDEATGMVHDLKEVVYFMPNQHLGSIQEPFPFEWKTTGTGDPSKEAFLFEVQPNPFWVETVLQFSLPKAQEVWMTITDVQGKEVFKRQLQGIQGMNKTTWSGRSSTGEWLPSGVYVISLQTEHSMVSRKVVLQRIP